MVEKVAFVSAAMDEMQRKFDQERQKLEREAKRQAEQAGHGGVPGSWGIEIPGDHPCGTVCSFFGAGQGIELSECRFHHRWRRNAGHVKRRSTAT